MGIYQGWMEIEYKRLEPGGGGAIGYGNGVWEISALGSFEL